MKTIDEVLDQKLTGLYFGNRIILPFSGYLLKVVIEDHIILDFSPHSSKLSVNYTKDFMEIYFREYKNIKDVVSQYEAIKLLAVEHDKDIFDYSNHRRIALYISENHKVIIEKTDEDILFIE